MPSSDMTSPLKKFRYRQRDHRPRQIFLARLRQCLQERGRNTLIYLDESGFEQDYPTLFVWAPW